LQQLSQLVIDSQWVWVGSAEDGQWHCLDAAHVGRGWQHAVQSAWLAQYTALVGMAWVPHEWSAHLGFLRQQLVHSGDL
jgi:hypothetical protein